MIRNYLKFLILLLALSPLPSLGEAVALPELGDSSATSLTPAQERQIGGEVVRRMRNAGYLIDDPLVTSYIKNVGRTLATHTQGGDAFTFFVVDAPSVNAFALPGGFIGVHSGLILASQTESELASVIAHEIAHVTQHHLARGVEQANRMQLPVTVALIAAILLNSEDSNLSSAVLAGGLAGSQQMQLNFSRAHEHEADRIGMQLLAESEYDPQGMAGFFARLQEQSRYYGEGVPEFLRTHPVTTSRLAEAQSAAKHYPVKMRTDAPSYSVAKARIRLHHSDSAAALMKTLQQRSEEQAVTAEGELYLKAITHIALQQQAEAEQILNQLLTHHPDSIAYRETLGKLHYTQGDYKLAVSLYRAGLKRHPHNELLGLSLASNLVALHDYAAAREQLQEIVRRNKQSAGAYQLLAQLESEAGNRAAGHLAQAEYYLLLQEPRSALEQLNTAKKINNLDFYHASRIDALSQEIQGALKSEQK